MGFMDFFKKKSSSTVAKDRLRFILVSDRANCSPELMEQIKNDINVVTLFKNIPEPYKSIEWKVNLTYANLLKDSNTYSKRELQEPIIIK